MKPKFHQELLWKSEFCRKGLLFNSNCTWNLRIHTCSNYLFKGSKSINLKLDFHLRNNFFTCFNDSPSKMMKNDFYFILKVFSFPRYLNFYLDFWACKKNRLIRKVNYEIYDVTVWLTKNYNTHIAQYLMN